MNPSPRCINDHEDVDRLPHGMVRTGYDADTLQYTFFDTTTQTHYVSAPGEAYGTLAPVTAAHFLKPSRGPGRKPTLQAYERTVFFADDTYYQLNSSSNKDDPPTTVHRSSTTVRKHDQGGSGRKRSSFSDLLPPHLIASASQSESQKGSSSPAKPRSNARRGRGGAPPSPPPTPSTPKPPLEKRAARSPPQSPSDSLSTSPSVYSDDEGTGSPVALLPPSKDTSPVSPGGDGGAHGGGARAPRLALRVLGRTLDAVKGGHRSRGGEQQPQEDGDEWVVV